MASICVHLLSMTFVFTLTTFARSGTELTQSSLGSLSLSPIEQGSVYRVLDSINYQIDWRSLYPDDLCGSGPHGLACDVFTDPKTNQSSLHVTELALGFVSDSAPSPSCSRNASLSASDLAPFKHLRKLFFYRCFTYRPVSINGYLSNLSQSAHLEELVFIENGALFGSFDVGIGSFSRLRKLVLSGNGVSGGIPDGVGNLVELEQIRFSRNRFNGAVSAEIGKLRKLRILDLGFNFFNGTVPESIGNLKNLLKLDLGVNQFVGRIPETLVGLTNLVFLDLSHNRFSANSGIPLFLSELQSLKEVYLSGNPLGGQIPKIWGKLGGILGIGFSGMGLVGNIPGSMGVFLGNLSYLSLDNNRLEGRVPEEFGQLSELNELNLERNLLSGKLPFSAKFWARVGEKLKVGENNELCVDEGTLMSTEFWRDLKVCSNTSDGEIIGSDPVALSGCSKECSLWFFFIGLVLVMVLTCFVRL